MKALSIQQPWAHLIVTGQKDIENRDWRTNLRGRIYIHAGKKIDKEAIEYIRSEYPDVALPDEFECGGIVGSVNIVGCVSESNSRWFFGDHGFLLKSPQVLPFRPYKGQLGFFEVAEESTATTTAKSTTAACRETTATAPHRFETMQEGNMLLWPEK